MRIFIFLFPFIFGSYSWAAGELPGQPSNIAASFATQKQIQVSWTDNSLNEEGFEVAYWDHLSSKKIARVAANVTDATLNLGWPASPGQIFFIQVYAVSSAGSLPSPKALEIVTPDLIDFVVQGRIVDHQTLAPIPGVEVRMRGQRTRISDEIPVSKYGDGFCFTLESSWPTEMMSSGTLHLLMADASIPEKCIYEFNLVRGEMDKRLPASGLSGLDAGQWVIKYRLKNGQSQGYCPKIDLRKIKFIFEDHFTEAIVTSNASGVYEFPFANPGYKEFDFSLNGYTFREFDGEEDSIETWILQNTQLPNIFGKKNE